MNLRFKSSAKILIISIFLGSLLVFGLFRADGKADISAQTPDSGVTKPLIRNVSVIGVGEVETQPDSALLSLGVQTEAESAAEAVVGNNNQMQSLLSSLESAGIPSEEIQTTTIRITPTYEFDETRNSRTLVGYSVTNMVEVRTDDLDNLGNLIDKSVQAGANTVENIRFVVSNTSELRNQAREMAFQDAQRKAEQLAGFTNADLGPVIEISESGISPGIQAEFAQGAVAEEAVPVQPGTQRIRITVIVTWQLTTDDLENESGAANVSITPQEGEPGTQVELIADGFPPNTEVNIGVGEWGSEYEVVQSTETGSLGMLTLDVEIPEYAEPGDEYVVVVAEDIDDPGRFKVTSNRFEVTE